MSQRRTWFRRSAAALAVGALAMAIILAACGSDESGGRVTADPGLAAESAPLTSGTMPPLPSLDELGHRASNGDNREPDQGPGAPASAAVGADVTDPGPTSSLAPSSDAGDGGGADEAAREAPTTNSVATTVLSPGEPCVTVVTTVPGQRFCDGYDPFPTPTGDDPNKPGECPSWATEPATRPEGGWLGTGGTPLDYLSRAGLGGLGDHPTLGALAEAADGLLPPEYVLSNTRARGVSACVEPTISLRVQFEHSDGSTVIVLTDRLIGQYDWSQQPPSGSIERRSLDGGAELATGEYSNGLALRAWVAQPDGSLLRVVAFGANSPTFSGYPTTFATQPTSVAPTPVPMTLDQVVDIALALAARG